jgi:hypothetical protein
MWQEAAQRHGFVYFPTDPFDITNRQEFSLFQQGHSKKVCNCIQGAYEGLPVLMFDYEYKTGSGKNQTTHSLSALLAELVIFSPHLVIRPEGVLDRLAAFFGFDDIQFESDEFNRAFNVSSNDKKFAYDICHPEMMEFLLQNQSMTWELLGNDLVLYSPTVGTFGPEDIEISLKLSVDFTKLIPGYLCKEAKV